MGCFLQTILNSEPLTSTTSSWLHPILCCASSMAFQVTETWFVSLHSTSELIVSKISWVACSHSLEEPRTLVFDHGIALQLSSHSIIHLFKAKRAGLASYETRETGLHMHLTFSQCRFQDVSIRDVLFAQVGVKHHLMLVLSINSICTMTMLGPAKIATSCLYQTLGSCFWYHLHHLHPKAGSRSLKTLQVWHAPRSRVLLWLMWHYVCSRQSWTRWCHHVYGEERSSWAAPWRTRQTQDPCYRLLTYLHRSNDSSKI